MLYSFGKLKGGGENGGPRRGAENLRLDSGGVFFYISSLPSVCMVGKLVLPFAPSRRGEQDFNIWM